MSSEINKNQDDHDHDHEKHIIAPAIIVLTEPEDEGDTDSIGNADDLADEYIKYMIYIYCQFDFNFLIFFFCVLMLIKQEFNSKYKRI